MDAKTKRYFIFPTLLALYEVCIYLSNDAYLPALPFIKHDLLTSRHLVQLTLTTWFMGLASMQLFSGPLADRVGRRPVLFWGGLIFILTSLGSAITHHIHALLFLRFVQGATIASMIVAGYATIHELFDREKAIHILSLMAAITVLAPSLGPLFGAFILQFSSWRMIFIVLAFWALSLLITLFFKMPETHIPADKKNNFKSILQQYKNIACNTRYLNFLMISRIFFACMIAWIAAGPFLLMNVFHFSTTGFALTQLFVFGSFIIGTRSVKFFLARFSVEYTTWCGIAIACSGALYSVVMALIFPHGIWNMIFAMMLLSAGSGLTFPIVERLGIESSQEPMGSRVAFGSLMMGVAGVVGSGMISQFYNDTLLSLGMILLLLCSAVFALRIRLQLSYRGLSVR